MTVLMFMSVMLIVTEAQVTTRAPRRSHGSIAIALNNTERQARGLSFECPANTGYVFDKRDELHRFIGCAPVGQRACMADRTKRLVGACPDGEHCCFSGNAFLGCSLTPEQCCFNKICPSGYTCCGKGNNARCCPLPTGETVPTLPANNYCSDSFQQPCLTTVVGSTECPQVIDPILCDELKTPAACGTAPKVLCQDTSHCKNGSDTLIPWLINTTISAPDRFLDLVPDHPVMCCSPSSTICIDRHREIIGCADPTRGETCCGNQICGDGYHCCSYTVPVTAIRGVPDTRDYEKVVGSRCCPGDSDCCVFERSDETNVFGIPLTNASHPNARKIFCGVPLLTRNSSIECGHATTMAPVVKFFTEMMFDHRIDHDDE